MNSSIRLRDPLGERTIDAGATLTIGGPGSSIPLPGIDAGVVLGRIALRADALMLEGSAAGLRCNGRAVEGVIALASGDVLEAGQARIFFDFTRTERLLRVDHLIGNPTSPPSFAAGDELLDGDAVVPAQSIPAVEFHPPTAGAQPVAIEVGSADRRSWVNLVDDVHRSSSAAANS